MNLAKFKKFISCFIVTVILLSFILPNFESIQYLAATVATSVAETTKKKPVGHKIEGAEYYDELWNKFSVIAIDNGGGSGGGGGAGDNNASNAGNSGTYNDAGGTFGQAAGQGLGTGNTANQAGKGSGTSGGTTGSVKADSLRALKAQIEESRAESLKRVLETAKDIESVKASIAERESIQNSIQKQLQKESVKAKIAQPETQKQHETPVYVETTRRQNTTLETRAEISSPTSGANIPKQTESRTAPTSVADTPRQTEASTAPTSVATTPKHTEERSVPTSRYVEKVEYNDVKIEPTPVYEEDFNLLEHVAVETTVVSDIEPGDFIAETNAKHLVTYNVNQTIVNRPTSAAVEETHRETQAEPTLEVFDSPLIAEETTIVEEEKVTDESVEQTAQNESKVDENKTTFDEEDGRGSKGGEDAEKEEDKTGDDGENESLGNANDRGKYQKETEGEHAGKKIFELDRNGDLGLNPEHLSVTNMKGMVFAVIMVMFLLGALTFVIGTKDRKNNNYF